MPQRFLLAENEACQSVGQKIFHFSGSYELVVQVRGSAKTLADNFSSYAEIHCRQNDRVKLSVLLVVKVPDVHFGLGYLPNNCLFFLD